MPDAMIPGVDDLAVWAASNGYVDVKRLPDGRLAAISPLTFGRARINVGDLHTVRDGY